MLTLLLTLISLAAEPPDGAERLPSRAVDTGILAVDDAGRITRLVQDSPAHQAGLRPGATLVRIDGLRVARMSPDEIRGRLRPREAQRVTVVAQDADEERRLDVPIGTYDLLNSAILTVDDPEAEPGAWWCAKGDCEDGNGKAEHSSGHTYIGYFQDGLPHGYGAWRGANGSRYDGGWREGLRHGPGTLVDADDNAFSGVFRDGLADGPFTVDWEDGRTYEGELRARVPHGRGTLILPDGTRYDGELDYGDYHGEGTLLLASGERFEGAFQNNIAHGRGRLDLPNGDHLEGVFYKGRLEGEGTRRWADDGRVYTGSFKANKPHGQGVLTWPDGRKHIGAFVDGEARGLGVHLWPRGERVVADFTDENRGLGWIIDGTGEVRYEGWIVRGKAEGWGHERRDDGELRRLRFYFNDKPRGDHPRSLDIGKAEKVAFEAFDWTRLEPLKAIRFEEDLEDVAAPAD